MSYTEEEKKKIAQQYKELLRVSYQTLNEDDKALIRKAFDLALEAHQNQRRKSGEAYVYHPIAVAKIVADKIGLDAISIASALLHDVVEDTEYTTQDIEREFGATIAKIVQGLTKIKHLSQDTDVSHQAENFRKMILTLNDDIRVVLIKIADRLHNMQTMESMPQYKQEKIASETLYIYAPLAHRIGLYNIKTELEDLGLKYTDPASYYQILRKIQESKEEQNQYIKEFSQIIKEALDKEGIECYIKGRSKSIFSIYKKMKTKGITYEEVYDKFAIRVIYKSDEKNERRLAWNIYSIVTEKFIPDHSRLRDWIATPRSTGYEALHTTVIGPKGRYVEVQIRSERMHEIAEKGYAAHFKYKHGDQKEGAMEEWLNGLREIFENNQASAVDFVEDFRMSLYTKEIRVSTPKGKIVTLPKGATPVDFAFSIHTEVGMQTRSAKVDGRIVPLNYKLKSGERVEIITDKNATPNQGWLNYVVTSVARSRIKSFLRQEAKKYAEEGKIILQRKLKRLKIDLNESVLNELVVFFKVRTSLEVFFQVAKGEISSQNLRDFASERKPSVVKKITNLLKKNKKEEPQKQQYDLIAFGQNQQVLEYTFATCCNPILGDEIFGFMTVNEGMKVHKKDCPNAIWMRSKYAYRIQPAKWLKSLNQKYRAVISISGINKENIFAEILDYVRSHEAEIHAVHFEESEQGDLFKGSLTLKVPHSEVLDEILRGLKKIKEIEKAERTQEN